MHTNVKTVLGVFLFFFFGFLALSELVGNYIGYIKTLDDPIPLLNYFKPNYLLSCSYHYSLRPVGECGPEKVTGL